MDMRGGHGMTITRPYDAEDNEVNETMRRILLNYTKKIGEVITEMSIYKYCVLVATESGRKFRMSQSQGCRSAYYNVRTHLYMCEEVDGKSARIKKSEW